MVQDQLPHLAHLIRCGLPATWLQVQDLDHVRAGEDAVAAALALLEAERSKQATEILKPDAGVGRATQDAGKDLLEACHGLNLEPARQPREA